MARALLLLMRLLLGACVLQCVTPVVVHSLPAPRTRVYAPFQTQLAESLDHDEHKNDALPSSPSPHAPAISLVETLPVGDFALQSAVMQTFDALYNHTQSAKESIDLSAMYWNLRGKDDRGVYSDAEMHEFGADRGLLLLKALHDAAARGVTLRILTAKESIGGNNSTGNSSLPEEVQELVDAFPKQVQVHCWSGTEWYGGGILHQKIWIFDKQHVYVGSANMDWKSLAQVMEVGVMMEHLPPSSSLLEDIQKLFDVWWLWASPDLPLDTTTYYSDHFQSQLVVPSWSQFLPKHKRIPDPFVRARLEANGNIKEQIKVRFGASSQQTHADMFVAAAPSEATAAHSRAFDEDALVYTIRNATSRVSLSVMDFVPYSLYTLSTHAGPISWPALTDALLGGIYAKRGFHVRLLISQWQHSNHQMFPALKLLQQQAALCAQFRDPCTGRLEIKVFHVPGWDNTTTAASKKTKWPAYTRVNHAKYIVTDARANIGTSNMEWGYFYTTAGASVNTDHEPTREALETLFNRNWDSSYAQPLNSTSVDVSLW